MTLVSLKGYRTVTQAPPAGCGTLARHEVSGRGVANPHTRSGARGVRTFWLYMEIIFSNLKNLNQ